MNPNNKLSTVTITGLALAIAALATTDVGVASASSASPSAAKTHTMTFNSVQTSQHQLVGYAFTDADTDKADGKVIGFDVVSGIYHVKTMSITADVVFSLRGGIIYLHGTGTSTPNKFTGSITGGTGTFKHATGTVTGSAYGPHDDNEHVTLTYS